MILTFLDFSLLSVCRVGVRSVWPISRAVICVCVAQKIQIKGLRYLENMLLFNL